MIELTRFNGNKFLVNSDLIKYVEAAPDTTLTLVTGEKLLVVESRDTVAELSLQYRAQVLRDAWPDALAWLSSKKALDEFSSTQDKEGSGSASDF